MKKTLLVALVSLFTFINYAQGDVFGNWETTNAETGKVESTIRIYKAKNGKVYGKLLSIADPNSQDAVCTKCEGSKNNKPILGMILIEGLVKDGDEYGNGTILDPTTGKIYDCKIWREGDDLKLRGYWGWLYRTETWKKA